MALGSLSNCFCGGFPPPKRSTVTVGVADTKGPYVVSAGPAPTDANATSNSQSTDMQKNKEVGKEVDDMLGRNPFYNLEHDIVEKPSWWQGFINGPFYQGKNVFGDKVFQKYYGGIAPGADAVMGEEGAAEGAGTVFKNISKRIRSKSTINFFVGITSARFEAALAKAAGKAWEVSADGKVRTLLYNSLKYVSRGFSGGGESTIEIWRDGELLQKYRLSQ
jgi:hypothetical protein